MSNNTKKDSNMINDMLSQLSAQKNAARQSSLQQSAQPGHSREDKVSERVISNESALSISSSSASASDVAELLRLRKQLEVATDKIAQMDQELHERRITQHTMDHILGPSTEEGVNDVTEQLMNKLSMVSDRLKPVEVPGDTASDRSRVASPTVSPAHFENFQPWVDANSMPYLNTAMLNQASSNLAWNSQISSVPDYSRFPLAPQPQRPTNLRLESFAANKPFLSGNGFEQSYGAVGSQLNRPDSGMGQPRSGWNSYPHSVASFSPPMTPMSLQSMNVNTRGSSYQQRSTGLSPTAVEFNTGGILENVQTNPWNSQNESNTNQGQTYMPPMEPMNYRRLLDRNMSCNWKYIVDKIVCSNDQQASIFLQQKLKVSTPEQKYELIEAIIAQAYPLMINRFGNFLIQRCFEHGTPDQVIAIAGAIRGNTLVLSMDAFGCHVVQKAFDVVPEDYKAIMVHELLRRIPETVIHRYACHVWQKLFELRWSDSPPQIMKYVNEALQGMWHEVALGETGSLVVQNIFENCLEEDKRPCITEVMASIDIVSHGQFGNWCIQHICEHGAPADKSRAIEHVLRFATEYSTDQFASKVVEKCLKVGGSDFLGRYLEKVCEGRQDRPRMPLIDIAGDQYGNYLIQFILIHADSQHRDIVAQHVRKHMVSLRGSKFGSRVAMLCCNPALATRPGPPTGMQMNDRFFQRNVSNTSTMSNMSSTMGGMRGSGMQGQSY